MSRIPCSTFFYLLGSAGVFFVGAACDADAETVVLANGQTYEVETDERGEPLGAENSEAEIVFLGIMSRASPASDERELIWAPTIRLKRNRDFQVTVTSPIDESFTASFEASGRGESTHILPESVGHPALGRWLDEAGTSWIPFVFQFENLDSGENFELLQWTRFLTPGKFVFLRNSYRSAGLAFPGDHPANESVDPPFDSREWRLGNQAVEMGTPQVVMEYVLSGETVDNWSELITVQSFIGAAESMQPADYIPLWRDSLIEDCPDAMWNVIRESQTDVIVESRTIGCAGAFDSDDQYEIARMVPGSWAMHRVAYTTKREPYLPEAERAEWIERIGRAEVRVADWVTDTYLTEAAGAGPNDDETREATAADARNDVALVYILREQPRPRREFSFFIDDRPAAFLLPRSYAVVTAAPGWHLLWGDVASSWFEFEAGREYFLRLYQISNNLGGNNFAWMVEDPRYLRSAIAGQGLARSEMTEAALAGMADGLAGYERVRRRADDPPASLYPAELGSVEYSTEPPGRLGLGPLLGVRQRGTLTVSETMLTYVSRDDEIEIEIEIDAIRGATIIGTGLDWLAVEYLDQDTPRVAFFSGPAASVRTLNDIVLAILNAMPVGAITEPTGN